MNLLSRILCCVALAHGCAALAEPVYKHTDSSGRVVYSSVKPATGPAAVAALPTIGRWKPRELTVSDATCEKHGGVACDSGADADGSVVCLDGYRDAVSRFAELCQQAKLELLAAPERYADIPTQVKATVRNNSAAPANGVLVSFIINKFDPPLIFDGPAKIEPYSVADFTVKTTLEEVPKYRKLTVADVSLDCGNCR